jgi:cell division protein FtsW (lipid II flippase)
MKADILLGGGLFLAAAVYLVQRNLAHTIVWLALVYIVASQAGLSHTLSVLAAIVGIYLISRVTMESFDNEHKEEKKEVDPKPAPPKTSDPHVDIGTTILHAYRNLTPEQIGGMRRDTKELMALQKELMGSLAEMKPAIEQGAELLKTFGTFFGKQEDGQ